MVQSASVVLMSAGSRPSAATAVKQSRLVLMVVGQNPDSRVLCCVMTLGLRSVQGHSSNGDHMVGSVGAVAPRWCYAIRDVWSDITHTGMGHKGVTAMQRAWSIIGGSAEHKGFCYAEGV